MKSVQSWWWRHHVIDVVLVSLLSTLNRLFFCFHDWLWTSKCRLLLKCFWKVTEIQCRKLWLQKVKCFTISFLDLNSICQKQCSRESANQGTTFSTSLNQSKYNFPEIYKKLRWKNYFLLSLYFLVFKVLG